MDQPSQKRDFTQPLTDAREHQLKAFVDAAERHGRDGRGKDGIIGYYIFMAKENPVEFAASLNNALVAQARAAEARLKRRRSLPAASVVKDVVLVDAILKAAEMLGGDGKGLGGLDGYLISLARKQPRQFAKRLGRLLADECAPGGPVELREIERTRPMNLKEYLDSRRSEPGEVEDDAVERVENNDDDQTDERE